MATSIGYLAGLVRSESFFRLKVCSEIHIAPSRYGWVKIKKLSFIKFLVPTLHTLLMVVKAIIFFLYNLSNLSQSRKANFLTICTNQKTFV